MGMFKSRRMVVAIPITATLVPGALEEMTLPHRSIVSLQTVLRRIVNLICCLSGSPAVAYAVFIFSRASGKGEHG